jgi:hypothetical protein
VKCRVCGTPQQGIALVKYTGNSAFICERVGNLSNQYSANESALGYLYQCRLALWYALSRPRDREASRSPSPLSTKMPRVAFGILQHVGSTPDSWGEIPKVVFYSQSISAVSSKESGYPRMPRILTAITLSGNAARPELPLSSSSGNGLPFHLR